LTRQQAAEKLTDTIGPDKVIHYLPDWELATKSVKNDSVTFTFVPLKGRINGIEKDIITPNFTPFLLVKNDETYYFCRFWSDTLTNEDRITNFLYNGTLSMKEVTSRRAFYYQYSDGKSAYIEPNLSKSSDLISPMGWEEQCHLATTCNWFTECYGAAYFYANRPGECTYPDLITPCDYSSVWQQTSPSYDQVCELVYIPDNPDPGTGGGVGGGGSNPGEPNSSDVDNYLSPEQQEALFNKLCANSFNFVNVVMPDGDGAGWKEASLKNVVLATMSDSYFEAIWTTVTSGTPIASSVFNLEVGLPGDLPAANLAAEAALAANTAMEQIIKKYKFSSIKRFMEYGTFPSIFAEKT